MSSDNRKLLVVILFVVLLLWGPIGPYGNASLIILPTLLWFGLKYFGGMWEVDKSANERLTRAIVAMLAGIFFVGAYFSFTTKYHSQCTQSIRTGDGEECVGDYIRVSGSDKAGGVMLVIFGGVAAWYAMSKHNDN